MFPRLQLSFWTIKDSAYCLGQLEPNATPLYVRFQYGIRRFQKKNVPMDARPVIFLPLFIHETQFSPRRDAFNLLRGDITVCRIKGRVQALLSPRFCSRSSVIRARFVIIQKFTYLPC